ncbi:component of IIS longevity pathway SMK-1-domain-containing protein [Podospora fimiseda]|uniref:Component of IIS longevity pathway SMK-1-domain-containing protein n=1 Tax=Podospora fimiseda TaxID=252190 RepID=A0AAN7BXT1_9PEZI|nr:component of IIS longevity pathway SMK-1-domain-containing protein [Podospora fimiseda]
MAQPVPHQPTTDKKRVKVYELRNNDWFDRGTGFCTACFVTVEEDQPKEPRVIVQSEDQPDRLLLESKVIKEDGFQKQQDTLIVWTDNGVDMALSFQEADGCQSIWKFIDSVQQTFQTTMGGQDDGLSDDLAMEMPPSIQLPPAELGSLRDLDNSVRHLSQTPAGRDALAKVIMSEGYIDKLIDVLEVAEDLESLGDLHLLCSIMKNVLLLNDTAIIEHAVSDECVIGVVGAMEYDPDFPSHKANHRQWLSTTGHYKEVVRIQDEQVQQKIHQTYRLQYLKDVVLARILDDPTFSVLNSLIFFNQVDIVQHLHMTPGFMTDLFAVFHDPNEQPLRKKEAVLFIQQCCAIAKNLQAPARQGLYGNFLQQGLLPVINFGLRHPDVSVRVGATDILVSVIDHDASLIRKTLYEQIARKTPPLTDTLIDLLLVEVDLGIKSHLADSLRLLLSPDPVIPQDSRVEFINGQRVRPQIQLDPQQDQFLTYFYDESAARLFKPLLDLEHRKETKFSALEDGIFAYLNEILCFCIRHHQHRSKFFVMTRNIPERFAQLLDCKEKHMQIVAIRFFRLLVVLQDEFYIKHIFEKQLFGPILDALLRTLPRDNLLGSACLDLFYLMLKEDHKELIKHIVEKYREKVAVLAHHIPLFHDFLGRYHDNERQAANGNSYFIDSDDDITYVRRPPMPAGRGEQLAVDDAQEAYWNTSDDEDENHNPAGTARPQSRASNGSSASSKPLVEYTSDEEEDAVMTPVDGESGDEGSKENQRPLPSTPITSSAPPPERLSEKRRREEEDDDALDKLTQHKRRNSSSAGSNTSLPSSNILKKKQSFNGKPRSREGSPATSAAAAKKISINISPSIKTVVVNPTASPTEGANGGGTEQEQAKVKEDGGCGGGDGK